MAKDIRESDTIPTERDKQVANDILRKESGEFDTEKMAHELVRLRRKELMQSEAQSSMVEELTAMGTSVDSLDCKLQNHIDLSGKNHKMVMECLTGDELGMNPGLIEMTKAIYRSNTGKDPTTSALHKKEDSDVAKYVYIGIGIIGALSVLLPYILS